MPAALVDLSDVELDDSALRFLRSKRSSTATAYEKCLKRFVVYYEKPVSDFIEEIEEEVDLNKTRDVSERIRPGEAVLQGFINWHDEVGYSNYSTRQSLAAVQNYLKYYGVSISMDFLKLPPARPMRENEKHAWTLEEIKEFVDAAEYLRDKAFILFAFQSGLSIGDILGLDYRDIQREYEAGRIPMMIHTYRGKTEVEFKTFIGRDAYRYLELYLTPRGELDPDDPIFTMLGSNRRASKNAIQKKLREYAEKVDFILDDELENGYNPARPHSLRAAFRSRLTGKMDGDLIEFFMGHDIGEEKRTYINMPKEELRELYANFEKRLAIEKTSRDERIGSEPRVTQQAFENLKGQVGALAQRNAELEARLEETRRQQKEMMRWLRRVAEQIKK